jgi:erythromycin esterase-like protein
VGSPPAGKLLADAFGAGYRVYALLAHEGAARAHGAKTELGVYAHPLPPAPDYLVEGTLASLAPQPLPDITYWRFDSADVATKRWLHELHWIRSFGANYYEDKSPYELYEPTAFDGAILLKTVSPSEPLDK